MNLNTFIKLFRDANNPVLFLGCGISRSAPSSVPLFGEMLEAYLDALDVDSNNFWERHAGDMAEPIKEKISNLPIDEFFADMIFAFGPQILKPLNWMEERKPNQTHNLISIMVRLHNIRTILTPNYDCLLEKEITDFETLSFIKRRSPTEQTDVFGNLNKSAYNNPPTILNPSGNVIIHLHGTSLESQIVITPETTSVAYDHFDHANLAIRLDRATVLVAGSSGGWDNDILDLLKRCNIKQVLWISHDVNMEQISSTPAPKPWKELFQERIVAIKGHTTKILAEIADKEYISEIGDQGLLEFRKCVSDHISKYDLRWKMYILAVLSNKVWFGNVAHSILDELEKLPEGAVHSENELVECGIKNSIWPIIIGRAKAIATSRNPEKRCGYKKVIKFLEEEVIAELNKILPYAKIDLKNRRNLKLVIREWMLAYESMGIFHLEGGFAKASRECLDKAIQVCMNKEDYYRLAKTKIIAESHLEMNELLGICDAKKIEITLQLDNAKIDNNKISDLLNIVDKCFFAGGRLKSLKIYKIITEKWPNNVNASLNYSNMLKIMGELGQALVELERCLNLNPSDYRILCNKGFLLNEMGRQHDSIPILESAIDLEPNDWHSWNNLGNSYYETGRLREALDCYRKALQCNPKFITAQINKENTIRRLSHQIW